MANLQGFTQSFSGGVSQADTTPFPHAVGTRARDASGNEYVYVDFTGSCNPESVVVISPTFTASLITANSRGMVGVCPDFGKLGQSENTPTGLASNVWTSDTAGWVQIYGRAYISLGAADVSASDAANGPTTVDTSAAIRFAVPGAVTAVGNPVLASGAILGTSGRGIINGMLVATDASLGGVSAFVGPSGIVTDSSPAFHGRDRMAVWLNYPYIETYAQPSV